MRLVSGARYAALQARCQQVTEARDEAVDLAAKRLSTITRQASELSYYRDQNPDAPLPYPRPADGDVELRRQLHLARQAMAALDQQCRELQRVNELQDRQLLGQSEQAREVTP